jgi:hypothetical protein
MLGVLLHAPRGPFYSPKAARSRWEHSKKAILAFCRLAHRTVRCGFLSFFGEVDHWRFGAVGAPNTVRCTPDSPVPLSTVGTCHASRADSAADRWPGRLLAHRTVRCTTGQSGAPPDSPVNFSGTPPTKSREKLVDGCQPGAPDTVWCTTGQSGAPRLSRLLAASSHSFLIAFSLILTLRQTC